MITENLSTLKIHKLTQEQYDRELAAGRIDESTLYLTPDEDAEMSKDISDSIRFSATYNSITGVEGLSVTSYRHVYDAVNGIVYYNIQVDITGSIGSGYSVFLNQSGGYPPALKSVGMTNVKGLQATYAPVSGSSSTTKAQISLKALEDVTSDDGSFSVIINGWYFCDGE